MSAAKAVMAHRDAGLQLKSATGGSGLILDVVVETGNPADAERFLHMLEFGQPQSTSSVHHAPPYADPRSFRPRLVRWRFRSIRPANGEA